MKSKFLATMAAVLLGFAVLASTVSTADAGNRRYSPQRQYCPCVCLPNVGGVCGRDCGRTCDPVPYHHGGAQNFTPFRGNHGYSQGPTLVPTGQQMLIYEGTIYVPHIPRR